MISCPVYKKLRKNTSFSPCYLKISLEENGITLSKEGLLMRRSENVSVCLLTFQLLQVLVTKPGVRNIPNKALLLQDGGTGYMATWRPSQPYT